MHSPAILFLELLLNELQCHSVTFQHADNTILALLPNLDIWHLEGRGLTIYGPFPFGGIWRQTQEPVNLLQNSA